MTMQLYEVQTLMCGRIWENCWTDNEGRKVLYTSASEARAAIAEHIADCEDAVHEGDLIDAPLMTDYRIVAVQHV